MRQNLGRRFSTCLCVCACLLLSKEAQAKTYYLRTDGGTPRECNGLADKPYPGSGTLQDCAFKRFLDVTGWKNGPAGRLAPGDTLIVDRGEHIVGFEPGREGCSPFYPYDCTALPIPSGKSPDQKTKILGEQYNQGCLVKSQLFGVERVPQVIDLSGSSNVEIQCLEITDHMGCGEHHPDGQWYCPRGNAPNGPWAQAGLRIVDSENLVLKNLSIHGLANRGVYAGRYKNIFVEDVEIVGNPLAGWDGDLDGQGGNDGVAGTNVFHRFKVQGSGCVETYPAKQLDACYTQGQGGGYGDGFTIDGGSLNPGEPAKVVLDQVDLGFNTSDGFDALYAKGDVSFDVKQSIFHSNVGQQFKVSGDAVINDSIVLGDCSFFGGKPFTLWDENQPGRAGQACNHNGVCDANENSHYCSDDCYSFINCRAMGNAMSFTARKAGQKVQIYGSTIYGQGDDLIITSGDDGVCNGSEVLQLRNDILIGDHQFGTDDQTAAYYATGATGNSDGSCGTWGVNWSEANAGNIVFNTKNLPCPAAGISCVDPKLQGPFNGVNFNVSVNENSPARGLRNSQYGTAVDYNNSPRKDTTGSLEFGSVKEISK